MSEKIEKNIDSYETKIIETNDIYYSDNRVRDNSLPLLNNYLNIPKYQRPFSWTKDQIRTLLNDIYDSSLKRESNYYFIGSVILGCTGKYTNNINDVLKFEIIDGQQRSIALFLIFSWFQKSDFVSNKTSINLESYDIDGEIIRKIKKCESNKEVLKFLSTYRFKSNSDSEFYRKWLDNDEFNKLQLKRFYSIYLEINNFFTGSDKFSNKEELLRYWSFLTNKVNCLIIRDKSKDQKSADLLFLSLNGKGLKLDEVDLLKSFFAMGYLTSNENLEDFKNDWSDFLKLTNNKPKSFLKPYFESQGIKLDSHWANSVQNEINKSNRDVKEYFKDINKFCHLSSLIDNCKTQYLESNFYLKSLEFFNFTKCKSVIYRLIDCFTDCKYEKKINLFLKKLFLVNLMYVTVVTNDEKRTSAKFGKNIINELLSNVFSKDNTKLLNDDLINGINFLDEKLKKLWSNSGFSIMNYRYTSGKTFQKDLIHFLFALEKIITKNKNRSWSEGIKYLNRSEYNIDHIVPKRNPKLYTNSLDYLNKSIDEFEWTVRTYNIMKKMNINLLKDLNNTNIYEIEKKWKKPYKEIKNLLKEVNEKTKINILVEENGRIYFSDDIKSFDSEIINKFKNYGINDGALKSEYENKFLNTLYNLQLIDSSTNKKCNNNIEKYFLDIVLNKKDRDYCIKRIVESFEKFISDRDGELDISAYSFKNIEDKIIKYWEKVELKLSKKYNEKLPDRTEHKSQKIVKLSLDEGLFNYEEYNVIDNLRKDRNALVHTGFLKDEYCKKYHNDNYWLKLDNIILNINS